MIPFSRFAAGIRGCLLVLASALAITAQEETLTPERLQALLRRFPAADTNRDGVLSREEAVAYAALARNRNPDTPQAVAAGGRVAPAPPHADVSYGPAPRNVLDFWPARSARPAPVVIYIHGGGFVSGDKSGVRRDKLIQECLDAGVAFAAINYRFLEPGVPIQDILRDAARAVQFIRWNATAWNVDPRRVAAYGGSAGAGISLWLAVHDDLAEPESPDPIRRQSTRLACAGSSQGQFSYDFLKWREVFGDEVIERFGGRYGSPANYGFSTQAELLSPAGERVRAGCDMIALISKDDPPIFISSTLPDLALENSSQFLHHPKHSQLLYERLVQTGVPVVANIPAVGVTPPPGGPRNLRDFLFSHLQVERTRSDAGR